MTGWREKEIKEGRNRRDLQCALWSAIFSSEILTWAMRVFNLDCVLRISSLPGWMKEQLADVVAESSNEIQEREQVSMRRTQ